MDERRPPCSDRRKRSKCIESLWTPFCLSSGDSRGVDLPAALSDEREDLSGKVTLQGSHGDVRVKSQIQWRIGKTPEAVSVFEV